MELHGRKWTWCELAARVGRLEQVARVRRLQWIGSPEAGVVQIQVRTGSGLAYYGTGLDNPLAEWISLAKVWFQMAIHILKAALARTAKARAALFLEPLNRYEAGYLRTVDQAAELCRAVDDPRASIVADYFHMNIEEADIAASLRSVAEYVGHIHLADSNRLLPGHGHISYVKPFRVLREIKFDGWLTLECTVPGEPAETLPAAVQFLTRCWEHAAPAES